MKKMYSLVIPLYNEEEVIHECIKRVTNVMHNNEFDYEIIFVNDGSSDSTEEIVKQYCDKDKHLKLISFSRNFGHQTAISAGMDNAEGDAIIVMDADLQDPPEVVLKLIEKYEEGFDVVYAIRSKRKGESFFKKITAKMFYRFLKNMCEVDIPVDTGDFRLISRQVCDVLKGLTERNRYVRGLVSWVGFKQTGIYYEREERYAGKTKYPLKKMLKLSVDGITSFSTKPLKLTKWIGIFMAAVGFIYAIIVIIQKLVGIQMQTGWASTMVTILLIGGIQLIMLGITGEYIARIFDESKNRPLYIIKEKVNMDE
ncbi:MAG: glycosyltransferase family 2 protein [Clostridia bacterium]|jgi:dolichol-phosphate mannosyltransferase|nr:glycosyltransferase family 2 protein [Clostridia bacterium]MDD3093082.1 glycosyltransferase family 2 protein [Clostridia bacterium]MDD3971151.1 glycosyltransferase family 2 protein [Clostridia bacterium]MDD4542989.1 glycosyltransferase family 2 protein [Clostridia bacterium]